MSERFGHPGSAQAPTREAALAKQKKKLDQRLRKDAELVSVEVGAPENPWLAMAGIFKDDPWIEDWKRSMQEYRRRKDADPDYL